MQEGMFVAETLYFYTFVKNKSGSAPLAGTLSSEKERG